jgi:hypothetical protein
LSDGVMKRWYTPILLTGASFLGLLILALLAVEVLVAHSPNAVASRAWTPPLTRVDEALQDGDLAAAMAWWREARLSAIRSGEWEGLIEVGDASRRLGEAGGFRPDAESQAREAYLAALLRAERQRSLEGVLRAAGAFGELGDREVTAHAIRIAERQAGRDPRALDYVRSVADRWSVPSRSTHRNEQPNPRGEQP